MNDESTSAGADVLVMGTGRIEFATTRQQRTGGADDALSGHSAHRFAAAQPRTPAAVAGGAFARSRLSHPFLRAVAADRIRDGGSATGLSGSGSVIRVHPGNRRSAGGEFPGMPA
ncbi:hypothetical protein SCWH03_18610 [Streptomyces pacificus]|uniref:Uncharacterized protein n=2 Tax=Streptomyces pacificus TaxID=2705029 RepID=A0A6A0ARV3_9ACTN|nr:hypothetical protein SCWH03_18610 [Streptomyces pacificus]